eukprot:1140329-Pelagomonas_calceolata.AAC.1
MGRSSTPLTLWSLFKSLVLTVIQPSLSGKLAMKLHAHSVKYAYRLDSTRRALEKTPFNSQAQATSSSTSY